MESDDEHNASDELQPRTSLRPTPAPFSHAPFKSAVPEVSLIFNNTKNQTTVNGAQTTPKSNTEDFESYNVWKHKNLRNADESSPRFKYYTTSPRYAKDVLPAQPNRNQSSDSPRMAPLQPINYRLPHDNLPSDSFERLRSHSPIDGGFNSHRQDSRRDINISESTYHSKYPNSMPNSEQSRSSPSVSPFLNSHQSVQSYQQSPQLQKNGEGHQSIPPQHQAVFHQNNHCVNPQNGNQSPFYSPNNFYQHENYMRSEIIKQRELCNYQIQERAFITDNLAQNPRLVEQERCERFEINHGGQGDRNVAMERERKGHEGSGMPPISVGDLYRLIQMQNEEIRGLRAQVQGLLDSKSGQEFSSNTQFQRRDVPGSNCATGSAGHPQQYQEQSRNGATNEFQDCRVNVETWQINGQKNADYAARRNVQQSNGQGQNPNENRIGTARNAQIQTTHKPQEWDQSTNLSAINGQNTVQQSNGQRRTTSNDEPSSDRSSDENRPIACQGRAMVQQVSIGVMTSFVDQNVYYKTPPAETRRSSKPNALLRQATSASKALQNGNAALESEPIDAQDTRAKQLWTQRGESRRDGDAQTESRRDESVTTGTSPGEDPSNQSLTLGQIEIEPAREQVPSPDGSMHLDLPEFCSSSESEDGDTPPVGWTFYHNMVGQVNEMLQTDPRDQHQQERSRENSYDRPSDESPGQSQPNTARHDRSKAAGPQRREDDYENDRRQERHETQQRLDNHNERAMTRNGRIEQNGRRIDAYDERQQYDIQFARNDAGDRTQRRNDQRYEYDVDNYQRVQNDGYRDQGRNKSDGNRLKTNDPNYYQVTSNYQERREMFNNQPMRYPAANQCQSNRQIPQLDKEAVRNATMQQLRKLGVSFCDQDVNTAIAASKKVTFDSVYYVPRAAPYAHANGNAPSDISLRMDALAMKYLHGEQLDEYARLPGREPQDVTVYDLASKVSNVSFATMRYLQRYQLLPFGAENQADAPPFVEQPARVLRQEPIRVEQPARVPRQEPIRVEQPARLPRQEPIRNNFNPTDCNQTTNVVPHKILDITALKQQPKFI